MNWIYFVLLLPLILIFACILTLLGVLLFISPGKPKPFLDKSGRPLVGSISEKVFIDINGTKQGMFIKGKDTSKPVLLYLHGGMPEYFLTESYPTGLEDYFTVVWWEQRGLGLSYHADISAKSITLEQMISDTLAVTQYLRQRFGKEKIYLMGHSGGTFIGIQAAAREPQLFEAYIGTSQMSNQRKSEQLAYEYMLKQFKKNGNNKMVRKLEAAPVSKTGDIPSSYLAVRDEAMHTLGIGTTHTMKSVLTGIIIPSFRFQEYTLGEKINLWRGKAQSGVSSLWATITTTDLAKQMTELKLPVYFIHGKYDYTVSYTEAKTYFKKLKAPVKGFYTFDQSAHSPMFEEPKKMQAILREDVMTKRNRLADKK